MRIVRVTDKPRDLTPLLRLDDAIFRRDRLYIPRPLSDRMDPYKPTHPFYRHGEAAHFAARSGRRVLGRISAISDMRLGHRIGWFGLMACRNDRRVVGELLEAAAEFLRSRGFQKMMGPVDLTIWHSCRIQTGGPRKPRYFVEPQYPPYLAEHLMARGLEPTRRFVSLDYPRFEVDDAAAARLDQRVRDQGYRIRPIDPTVVPRELTLFHGVATASFTGSMGYVPLSRREFHGLYRGLAKHVEPSMVLIAEDPAGQAVGFTLAMPDLTAALRGLGRGGPLSRVRALRAKLGVRRMMVKTLAVHPDHQGKGLASAMSSMVHRAGKARGLNRTLHAFFDESNEPSIRAARAGLRCEEPAVREYAILGTDL